MHGVGPGHSPHRTLMTPEVGDEDLSSAEHVEGLDGPVVRRAGCPAGAAVVRLGISLQREGCSGSLRESRPHGACPQW